MLGGVEFQYVIVVVLEGFPAAPNRVFVGPAVNLDWLAVDPNLDRTGYDAR